MIAYGILLGKFTLICLNSSSVNWFCGPANTNIRTLLLNVSLSISLLFLDGKREIVQKQNLFGCHMNTFLTFPTSSLTSISDESFCNCRIVEKSHSLMSWKWSYLHSLYHVVSGFWGNETIFVSYVLLPLLTQTN